MNNALKAHYEAELAQLRLQVSGYREIRDLVEGQLIEAKFECQYLRAQNRLLHRLLVTATVKPKEAL